MERQRHPVPTEAWWTAGVHSRRDDSDLLPESRPTLTAILQRSRAGSAPLLCLTDSGQRYWVKMPGNPQGSQTLVAEVVVASIAPHLEAPVLPAALLDIPESWIGARYGPDGVYKIPGGLAHGSPLIEPAVFRDEQLSFPHLDDNPRRIPRLVVLWEWAMGSDPQWLYAEDSSRTIWSFDHGFWLDSGEGPWTRDALRQVAQMDWTPPSEVPGRVDTDAFLQAADRLERVTAFDLVSAVSRVPRSWEPDDALLGALAQALYGRRLDVARRARAHAAHIARGGRR